MGLVRFQQLANRPETGIRILVVDGHGEAGARLVEALQGGGFEAVAARATTDALFSFAIHLPDVVIIDIPIYGADRWEPLRRLREFSDVPIIAVTSGADEGAAAESLRLGADHAMTRPVAQREMAARIRALVRRTLFAARAV